MNGLCFESLNQINEIVASFRTNLIVFFYLLKNYSCFATPMNVSINGKKDFHYRTGQGLGVPGRFALESGKVVSPTHRPPLLPGNILEIYVRG